MLLVLWSSVSVSLARKVGWLVEEVEIRENVGSGDGVRSVERKGNVSDPDTIAVFSCSVIAEGCREVFGRSATGKRERDDKPIVPTSILVNLHFEAQSQARCNIAGGFRNRNEALTVRMCVLSQIGAPPRRSRHHHQDLLPTKLLSVRLELADDRTYRVDYMALIDARGAVNGRFFAIGPMLKEGLWETTAVRELRCQARDLAGHLIDAA